MLVLFCILTSRFQRAGVFGGITLGLPWMGGDSGWFGGWNSLISSLRRSSLSELLCYFFCRLFLCSVQISHIQISYYLLARRGAMPGLSIDHTV
ncbi:hypothetical protein BU16DRAFT_150334 [Lophium mytilinum]|uniref:Uncharacterized protein n=1 Tax=Lophium mytilinum TaxID=390894 RepID=A0A6A6QFG7_9PEZI|nr:hypothetical protein BU16DRAFT_150334 [Lophium mytilinum]